MFRRAYLSLLVAVFVFAAVVWLDRKASADVPNGQAILVVSPTSMQSAPGPIIQASTQPVTITVTFSTTAPTPSDPEATVTSTGYTLTATVLCKGSLSGSYASPSADSGISLTLSPGNGPALSVTGSGSDATFTISGVFPVGAYYDISLSGTATFTDSDGNNYSVPASGDAYVTAVKVDIVWNGVDTLLDTDGNNMATGSIITNKSCYIATGVECRFTGSVSPSDLAKSNPQWTMTGTKTIDFAVSADLSTGSPTSYPGSDLTQYTTDKFFWSDNSAGNKTVQFSVTVNGSALFATSYFTYELPTSINLLGPPVQGLPNTNMFPFAFSNLMLQFVNTVHNMGVWLNPTWTAPAHWTPAQHPGQSEAEQFVQLLSDTCQFHHPASNGNADYWVILKPGSGLDTEYPYGNNAAPLPIWSDNPSEPYDGDNSRDPSFPDDDDKVSWACSFNTYWAYKPAAADAQFVPLYSIQWHVRGTMSLIAGQNPLLDASWNPVIAPAAAFDDNGNVADWYQWSQLAGNVEMPVKE